MIFISNKYKRIYDAIILKAQYREQPNTYTEKHHIIPRSLGGSNDKSNIAILTAREHFICHILLPKFTSGQNRHKMLHAAIIMKGLQGRDRYINSRLFEEIKKEYSKIRKINTTGSNNHRYGVPMSDETKLKISNANKGRNLKGKYQPPASEETKAKMRRALGDGRSSWWNNGTKNKRQKECPGDGWVRGRLKSSMPGAFVDKKVYARKFDTVVLKELATGKTFTLSYDELKDFKKENKNIVGQELKPRKRAHLPSIKYVIIEKKKGA